MLAWFRSNLLWVGLALGVFLFSLLVPITGDDFTFLAFKKSVSNDLSGLLGAFSYMYENLNGRIIGNGLEFLLIDNPLLSALVRSAVILSIIALAINISGVKSKAVKTLGVILLVMIPVPIFAQTYAWQAGFFNYVTPVLLLLVILKIITGSIVKISKGKKLDFGAIAILLAMSFASGLFVESVNIAVVGTSLVALTYLLVKKLWVQSILPLSVVVGALLSSVVMFSSPVYSTIASGEDGYRSVGSQSEGLYDKISSVGSSAYDIVSIFVNGNIILITLISFVLVYIISKAEKRTRRRFALPGVIIAFFPLYVAVSPYIGREQHLPSYMNVVINAAVVLLAAAFVMSVYLTSAYFARRRSKEVQAMLLLGVSSIAPFLVISPFGPRNFYLLYVCLVVVALVLLDSVIVKKVSNFWYLIAKYVLLLVSIFYISIFTVIHLRYSQNISVINSERSNPTVSESVQLKKYPFSRFIHDSVNNKKTDRYMSGAACSYTSCDSRAKVNRADYR